MKLALKIERNVRAKRSKKMKPKEKALDIAMKFDKEGETDNAIKCALISVEEILFILSELNNKTYVYSHLDYWKNVKYWIKKSAKEGFEINSQKQLTLHSRDGETKFIK